jgi:hypothetical protein
MIQERTVSKKTKFPEIRAELKQREEHSKSIHARIRQTAGEERMKFWDEKKSYGRETRFLLLYYAMLRGMPHYVCEQNYNPCFDLAWGICHQAKRLGREYDIHAVADWLKQTKPAAVEAAE